MGQTMLDKFDFVRSYKRMGQNMFDMFFSEMPESRNLLFEADNKITFIHNIYIDNIKWSLGHHMDVYLSV